MFTDIALAIPALKFGFYNNILNLVVYVFQQLFLNTNIEVISLTLHIFQQFKALLHNLLIIIAFNFQPQGVNWPKYLLHA